MIAKFVLGMSNYAAMRYGPEIGAAALIVLLVAVLVIGHLSQEFQKWRKEQLAPPLSLK